MPDRYGTVGRDTREKSSLELLSTLNPCTRVANSGHKSASNLYGTLLDRNWDAQGHQEWDVDTLHCLSTSTTTAASITLPPAIGRLPKDF